MIQIKIAIIAAILLVSNALSVWATYQIISGKHAKQLNKAVAEAIENSNQDKVEIQKHVEETKIAKAGAVREITKIQIKKVFVPGDCPLDAVSQLRNETYSRIPPKLYLH